MKTTEIKKQIALMLTRKMSKKDRENLIKAIASQSKLTKADAGRMFAMPITIQILIAIFGMSKKELIDSIAAGSKLTKADADRIIKRMTEAEILEYVFGMKKGELIDAIASHSKLTKADAGRALDATIKQIKTLKVVFGGKGQ